MSEFDLINETMDRLSSMNDGRSVVLHLDASMLHELSGGALAYLPVMNIEGDAGYYRFPDPIRDEVAEVFGDVAKEARRRVNAINQARGFSQDQAREVVMASITRSRGQ